MPDLRIPPGFRPLPPSAQGAAAKASAPPAQALPYGDHLRNIQAGDGTARARMLAALDGARPRPGTAPRP